MQKIFFLIFLIFSINCYATNLQCNGKQIIGSYERINIENNLKIDAKIDTGADMSSLSATDIEIFKQNNQQYVRFSVLNSNKEKIPYTKPLIEYVNVLKRQEESNDTKQLYGSRPVVAFDICLAGQKHPVKINLIDRSHFQFPMLIGNRTLKQFHLIIDPAAKYLSNSTCP